MAEITVEAISKAVEGVVKQELDPVKTSPSTIEKTLVTHTTALDQLLKEKQTREDERAVSTHRFERLENWARKVGEQLGIKLEF